MTESQRGGEIITGDPVESDEKRIRTKAHELRGPNSKEGTSGQETPKDE